MTTLAGHRAWILGRQGSTWGDQVGWCHGGQVRYKNGLYQDAQGLYQGRWAEVTSIITPFCRWNDWGPRGHTDPGRKPMFNSAQLGISTCPCHLIPQVRNVAGTGGISQSADLSFYLLFWLGGKSGSQVARWHRTGFKGWCVLFPELLIIAH